MIDNHLGWTARKNVIGIRAHENKNFIVGISNWSIILFIRGVIGGREQGGKRGRGAGKKAIVVIAIEVHDPKGFGRVRMKRIPDMSGDSLIPFICENVQQNSTIITDCWKGYNTLQKHEYTHKQINLSKSGDPAHVHLPGVHRIASLLKRLLLSTHQGAVSPKHLDYYLDEYTFRFNRRTSRARGLLFYRLLEQAVCISPVPYKEIIDDGHKGQ